MFVLPKEYKRGKIEEFAIPQLIYFVSFFKGHNISTVSPLIAPQIEIEDEERWRNVLES